MSVIESQRLLSASRSPARAHVPRGGRVGHRMQLHRQLSELREGGARRGEDLSDLGAGQRHGGPAHSPAPSRPEPLAPPQVGLPLAPRPGRKSREPTGGPALPWPPGSAVREGGRTFVDADVMAPSASSRRRRRCRYLGAGTTKSQAVQHPGADLLAGGALAAWVCVSGGRAGAEAWVWSRQGRLAGVPCPGRGWAWVGGGGTWFVHAVGADDSPRLWVTAGGQGEHC